MAFEIYLSFVTIILSTIVGCGFGYMIDTTTKKAPSIGAIIGFIISVIIVAIFLSLPI